MCRVGRAFIWIIFMAGALSVARPAVGDACRLYGAISDGFPDGFLQSQLVDEPNSLKNLAESGHVDGWGIGYYPAYGDPPIIARGAERAFTDTGYDAAVASINASKPTITIAHIRHCTSGCCDHGGETIPNPHPFYRDKNGKRWVFAHNGGVAASLLTVLIGPEYLGENPLNGSGIPECMADTVGSELYFLYLIKNIEENDWNVVEGIVAAARELIAQGEEGMNFLLSDGNTMWTFRRPELSYHTLYFLYDAAAGYSAVASEHPPSAQGNWQPIESGELLVLAGDAPPEIINVENYSGELLADPDFDASTDTADLRTNSPGHDWHESRGDATALLTLDETYVAGNVSSPILTPRFEILAPGSPCARQQRDRPRGSASGDCPLGLINLQGA